MTPWNAFAKIKARIDFLDWLVSCAGKFVLRENFLQLKIFPRRKLARTWKVLTERQIIEQLKREPLQLYPLDFVLVELPALGGPGQPDAAFDISWRGKRGYRFLAEIKGRATPQAILTAAHQAKGYAFDRSGTYPLVLVPYLSPARLDELEKLGVSAVDLCGNGVVQVPDQWLVVRAGNPNRFPDSEPLRSVYRGVASLVARAFLAKPTFARVSDVQSFIQERAGAITLATVSKAISRLEEDLIVSRGAEGLRLFPGREAPRQAER